MTETGQSSPPSASASPRARPSSTSRWARTRTAGPRPVHQSSDARQKQKWRSQVRRVENEIGAVGLHWARSDQRLWEAHRETIGECKHKRPGPKYQLDNITCGIQVQSKIRSAPAQMKFSTGQDWQPAAPARRRAWPSRRRRPTTRRPSRRASACSRRAGTSRASKFMTGPRTYNNAAEREEQVAARAGAVRLPPGAAWAADRVQVP